jgi:hypothetical protein
MTKTAAQKKQERDYKARIGDYLTVFTSDAGRRVLKDMRNSYCGHIFSPEMTQMSYDMGKRAVVKDIEAIILAGKDPQALEDLFRLPEDDEFEL